ncbi:MAG: SprB repeat-containing protein [Saprospiraceae bacterium]
MAKPTVAIDLTISGAIAPYSFSWSNGETSEDLSGLLPGSYTVTVTAANSCSTVQTFNVANNSSSFSLSGVETPLTSCVSTNGAIDLTITPAGTYTIEWSNSETTEDLANLPAGTYVVTVTESGSCSASATFVIEDDTSNPEISQSISPEICGQENGSFDITVMGGTMPYTFLWSNGATSEDLIGVASDIYTVTVTGLNGCSAETTAEVPDNSISFSIQGTPAANTSCGTNNGSIDISVTPAGNYTYAWSNGAITEDISGLAGGGYSVVVSAGATARHQPISTCPAPLKTRYLHKPFPHPFVAKPTAVSTSR